MQSFGVVQAHRTSSNLHEPHHHRDSKVCGGFSHEFGVVLTLLKLPFRKKSNLPVSLQLRGCLNTSFLRGSMMIMMSTGLLSRPRFHAQRFDSVEG